MIGLALLLEVIVEQFLPIAVSSHFRTAFLLKDVCQSLAVVILATKAAGLSSRKWHCLGMIALLNAVLTVAAAMSLGTDQVRDLLQNLYPQATKDRRIHRRYQSE